jgi:hypothetical protein
LSFELIADLAHLVGLRFATRILEVDQIKTRFPKNVVAATLLADVAKSIEEVTNVLIVDVGVALTRHQLFQRFLPIAHSVTFKPKRLGLSSDNPHRLALLAITFRPALSLGSFVEALNQVFSPNRW